MKRDLYKVVLCIFFYIFGAYLSHANGESPEGKANFVSEGTEVKSARERDGTDKKYAMTESQGNETDIKLLLEALLKKEKEIEAEKKKNDLLKKENESLRKEMEQLKHSIKVCAELMDKEKARFLYDIGCIYRKAGLYKEAESAFLESLKLSPNDAYTHYNLAVLYDDDFNNKTAAKAHYIKFLELASDDSDAGKVREWLENLK